MSRIIGPVAKVFGGLLVLHAQAPLATNTGTLLVLESGGIVWCEGGWQNLPGGAFTNSGTVYISADIRNDDPGQFFLPTAQPGTLILNGSQQVLFGQHPIRTDTIGLLNTAPKILQTPLYVDQLLDLGDAELRTGATFAAVRNPAPTAITRNGGFVSSDQGGYLERATNSTADYLFPVGGHTPLRYQPAYVTPTTSAPHRWAVRLANTDPNNENLPRTQRHPDICEINPLYYHYIDRLSGTDAAHLTCLYDPTDPVKGPLAQWRPPTLRWEPTSAIAGVYPNSWQVQNVSDFQTPNWAFSAPGFGLILTAFPETIEPGQSTTLTATTTPPLSNLTYTWNVGDGTTSTAPSPLTHVYQAPGTYLAIVIARSPEGCVDTATARIVVNLLASIFIPNAFSPNGDGVNELWTPFVTGIKNARWILYDRWGMEVARGEGLPIVWDGTRSGQDCPEGVYTYLIELERFDGEKVRRAGTIMLLR